ncbi:MAG: S1C family serine protease [Gammaproteobacteria bacterium]|nr:S1C family serine protease [Gammaproteobacteria bacterium]
MPKIPQFTEAITESALEPLVSVRSHVPDNAMTAGLLGTERSGHGVRIRDDGLIVTVGYVVSEADEIWIGSYDGMAAPGVVIGNDFQSGLALIKPTIPLPGSVMKLGRPQDLNRGDAVTVAGSVGIEPQKIQAQVVARQEFAGRWEYVLDDAIFTAPPHQHWSGGALIDLDGLLHGIGSLIIQGFEVNGSLRTVNMFVPIELILPVIDEICDHGRRLAPPRPWLGILAHDEEGELTIVGVYRNCPADDAGLRPGDIVTKVNGQPIHGLANLFRSVWKLGDAGVDVPLTILRNSERRETVVKSSQRAAYLWKGTVQ